MLTNPFDLIAKALFNRTLVYVASGHELQGIYDHLNPQGHLSWLLGENSPVHLRNLEQIDMDSQGTSTEAGRRYVMAYTAHYKEHNLSSALEHYRALSASQSGEPEAEYSRQQIQNIFNSVVPAKERIDVQIKMAIGCLDRNRADGAQ